MAQARIGLQSTIVFCCLGRDRKLRTTQSYCSHIHRSMTCSICVHSKELKDLVGKLSTLVSAKIKINVEVPYKTKVLVIGP